MRPRQRRILSNLTQAALIVLALIMLGCTHYRHVEVISPENLESHLDQWSTIAVMPLTGPAYINRITSQWLAHKLKAQDRFTIIDPEQVRIIARENGIIISTGYTPGLRLQAPPLPETPSPEGFETITPTNQKKRLKRTTLDITAGYYSNEDAARIGRITGADLVVTGYTQIISSVMDIGTLIEVRLIDVKTAQEIATVHRTATKIPIYRLTDMATESAERAATEILIILGILPPTPERTRGSR